MITYDQAVYFLEKILRMPSSWKELLRNKPLEFLSMFIKRHFILVPYQNLGMACVEQEHRWFPSEEQLAENGLSGRGGCCIHLNYFAKMVFQAIGLDSFVVRGDHYCAPIAGTHCLVMVKLHEPFDDAGIYMIELGGAYPMLEPVPMDREKLPYRTMQAGGFPYEFREFAPGWIGKFHLRGGLLGGEFTDKDEILRTSWDLRPRALWEFDYPMMEVFTSPINSNLLRNPLMIRFFSNTEFCQLFPDLSEDNVSKAKDKSTTGTVILKGPESKVVGGLVPLSSSSRNNVTPPTTNGFLGQPDLSSVKGRCAANFSLTNAPDKLIPAKNVSNKLLSTKPEMEKQVVNEFENITAKATGSFDEQDLEDPRHFVFAFKRRLVIADAHTRKVVKNYDTYAEMGEDFKKYFQTISPDLIDKAMEIFSNYEPAVSPYDKIL